MGVDCFAAEVASLQSLRRYELRFVPCVTCPTGGRFAHCPRLMHSPRHSQGYPLPFIIHCTPILLANLTLTELIRLNEINSISLSVLQQQD